jgi:hypothetical protein
LVFFLQIRWCFYLLFYTPESRSCCHRRLCPSALVFILVQETMPSSGILFIYRGLALFVVHSCVRHCQTSAGIQVVLVLSFLLFLLGLGLACWSPRQAYVLVPFLPSVCSAFVSVWHVLRSCCVRAWGSRIGRCYVCGSRSLQGEAGIALESPDQKTRGFMVQIVLPR